MIKIWSWRHAVAKAELEPLTKLVLYTLALHMNETGEGCYPSLDTLMAESGLARASVVKYLDAAEAAGFIRRKKHGFGGQKWARNEYFAAYPKGFALADASAAPEAEKGSSPVEPPFDKGSSPGDKKAVHHVNSNSSLNSTYYVDDSGRETYRNLSGKLQDMIASPWPMNMHRCHAWMQAGADAEMDIVPTVQAVLAKMRASNPIWMPGSIKYFEAAVLQAAADRKAGVTLPTASTPGERTKNHGKHSGFNEIDYASDAERFNGV